MLGVDVTLIERDVIGGAVNLWDCIPDWAAIDGDRILATQRAYPPKVLPDHAVVIGSGVTGVELVHLFRAIRSSRRAR